MRQTKVPHPNQEENPGKFVPVVSRNPPYAPVGEDFPVDYTGMVYIENQGYYTRSPGPGDKLIIIGPVNVLGADGGA